MKILVIGAGIGGLTAAIALARKGHEVRVYERAAEIRPVGAGIMLASNATRVLDVLGLGPSMREIAPQIRRAEIITSRGAVLSSVDTGAVGDSLGAPTLAIHRADLHQMLLDALPSETVSLGHDFVSYSDDGDSVSATFANGERVSGDLLIGADGLRSRVRAQLKGAAEPVYQGSVAWRGVSASAVDHVREGYACEAWGNGTRFGYVRVSGGHVYWYATAHKPKPTAPIPVDRNELRNLFGEYASPMPEIIESTRDEEIICNDLSDRDPAPGWSKGRVTLLGDAAHPTTPNLGQGGCQAIEDGWVLAECLSVETGLAAALERYEHNRYARTKMVTLTSRRIGHIAESANSLVRALRGVALRLAPASAQRAQLLKLADFPLEIA